MHRRELLHAICVSLCDGEPPDVTDTFFNAALLLENAPCKRRQRTVTPLTELCFSELPQDDKDDMQDVAEIIKRGRHQRTARELEKRIKQTKTKKRARATGPFARRMRRRRGGARPGGDGGGDPPNPAGPGGAAAGDADGGAAVAAVDLAPAQDIRALPNAGLGRGRQRQPFQLAWEPVFCDWCAMIEGQMKFNPNPPDAPPGVGRWEVQVMLYSQNPEAFATRGQKQRKVRTTAPGVDETDRWARNFIHTHRECCL